MTQQFTAQKQLLMKTAKKQRQNLVKYLTGFMQIDYH